QVGERLEAAHGDRTAEIAAELAAHFEQGRDYGRAVRYLRQAAEKATRRHANREALYHLGRALGLVDRLPEAERAGQRGAVLGQRGQALRSSNDMAGAARDFAAVVACARQRGRREEEAHGLFHLASVLAWVDHGQWVAVVEQARQLSGQLQDPFLQAHTRGWSGFSTLVSCGWRDEDARACADAVEAARGAGG